MTRRGPKRPHTQLPPVNVSTRPGGFVVVRVELGGDLGTIEREMHARELLARAWGWMRGRGKSAPR